MLKEAEDLKAQDMENVETLNASFALAFMVCGKIRVRPPGRHCWAYGGQDTGNSQRGFAKDNQSDCVDGKTLEHVGWGAVDASSLKVSKTNLDGALSNLV
ncbi:hypothetical protein DUI87_16802 [Hirundo rustica rustica]|uniref:Uncharacterized protein n=1 Tax=Hirundo rustica rustica TaxID=333673 RepID=A0A3M0K279_HIRRU|nr:hypothetical protein DUI87_16802 [Hirundo rustica rustica]